MSGVQTMFDKDVFRRYMMKPIKEQKLKNKSNYKKITIEEKMNVSNLINTNLSMMNFSPTKIGDIFLYDDDLIAERDIYIRLMSKPLNLKDNEFIYEIVKYITKGTFEKSDVVTKDDESDWGNESQSLDIQNSSMFSSPIEEVNFYGKNKMIKRFEKLLLYSDS